MRRKMNFVIISMVSMLVLSCANSSKKEQIYTEDAPIVTETVVEESEVEEQESSLINKTDAEMQFTKCYNNYQRLEEMFTGKMNRVQVKQHEKELREAKDDLLYWLGKRIEEIEDEKSVAGSEGNDAKVDACQNELDRLYGIADKISDDDEY
jgi:hypothetical protein